MNRKRALLAVAGLLAVGGLGLGVAATIAYRADAAHLVARGEQAMRDLPRRGRIRMQTWYGCQPVESLADVEYGPEGRYRLAYRTPPFDGVLCVADPPHLWRLDPRRRLLEETSVQDERTDLALLLTNYRAWRTGEGMVAGRPVDRVVVVRRHGRRVARRLWLDRETGLPLRAEEYGPRGTLRCLTEYQSITYRSPRLSRFARPTAVGARLARSTPPTSANAGPTTPQQPLLPSRVPAGYRRVDSQWMRCFCGCGSVLIHTRYTDGLESLSLFECGHAAMDMAACAPATSGQDNVAGRIHRGHTFVVVGRASHRELERMLQSLPEQVVGVSW